MYARDRPPVTCATPGMGSLCVCDVVDQGEGRQHSNRRGKKQNAEQQTEKRTGIRVAPRKGAELICGITATKGCTPVLYTLHVYTFKHLNVTIGEWVAGV